LISAALNNVKQTETAGYGRRQLCFILHYITVHEEAIHRSCATARAPNGALR